MRASVTGRLASAMLMVLALAAALAVSPSPPASAQPRERNQVVLGFYQDVDTFNVLTLSTDAGSIAIRAFMDPLVEGDPKWKYQPILVSEIPSLVNKMWRVLPNGRMELTWKLRPNVRWHDGKPFTSADVLFTHQLATDSRIPVTYSLCGNAPHIESVQAPDPLTVVVTYRRVYAFAYQCVVEGSRWGAVPRHIFEPVYQRNPAGIKEMALGKDARLTIGNGPFRFRHWLPGNEIFFEANADYWRGRPRVGRLFFRYFADVNTLLTNLLAGAVDASGPAPSGIFFGQGLQLEELIAQGRAPGLVVKFGPTTVFDALVLNHDVPFFRDRRVRQALAHATDRESISQALFKGKQPVAHSFISSHFPGYLQSIRKYPYDLDRARALLQEAGYTMGSDGVLRAPDGSRFSVVFTVATGNRDRERAQQVIRENWRRIGVEAVIQNLPSRVISAEMYFQRRYRGLLINSHSANADYSNADRFFASWEVRPVGESSRNVLGYRNARMDELIRQYLQEPDEAKRMRKLQEWQAFFAEELPLIPLYAWTAAWAYKEGLENFQPTGTSGIPSPFTWNAHLWQWRK